MEGKSVARVESGGAGRGDKILKWKKSRTGTKNIRPGTALVYDPPLENLP